VHSHITAWKAEYGKSIWKGPYSIGPIRELVGPGARVLDAGCGSGKMSVPLARAGYRVTAMDVVKEGLRELDAPGIGPVQGDVRELPFKGSAFEAVVCYDVLQHLLEAERAEAVDEICRVLAPGGLLFLENFGRLDMRYGGTPVEPHTFRRQSGIIYHYFSEDEVRGLLSRFESVTVESAVTYRTFRGVGHRRHRVLATARKA
jgi:2-polyprenyl-3-methyl-5-hydroxy-6-metoxy-1,4-benzoquinol methylase